MILIYSMKKPFIIFLAAMAACVQAEVIRDIRIVNQLGESYDISSVAAFTSFSVGEEVSDREAILSAIATDVNRMRESDRFSYVDARMDIDGNEVVLVYTVVAKHRLRRIEIVGGPISGSKISAKSELKIGQFADEAAFEQAAASIRESYRDYWYPDVTIDWISQVDEALGVVDVTFMIEEGRKMGVRKIQFEGNDLIDDKQLVRLLRQKRKKWHSFITGAGKYERDLVDADVFSIKSFYMNNGFLDVQVSDPVLDDRRPKQSALTYTISEGRRYRIGEVTVSGTEEFDAAEVRKFIQLREGDIASYENIESGRTAIQDYYGNRGYVRTGVEPVYNADADTGIVDVEYEVTEGRVGYIGDIHITGNERTLDRVMRRELVVYPGEQYNRSKVLASRSILQNLNYFEYVDITPTPVENTDTYDLDIQVKEKPTGQFTAGLGFSSVDALTSYVELSQGNFNWKTWPPVGAGQKFKIRAQVGTRRNDFDISFVEPWFLNRKLSFGVDLFHREARYFSDNYEQKTDGMRLSLGKPFSRFTRGNLAYSLEQFDIFDIDSSASQSIQDEEGKRLKSSLTYTLSYDSRDRFFNPTRGNKTTVSPYAAGGPFGAETDIYGASIRSTHYWKPVADMIFNVRGQIESVEAFGDSKVNAGTYGNGVPLFDRLFLGGSYNLRGYEYRDIGPREDGALSTDDSYGGNSSAFATAEMTYPIWKKIRGAVFYDWGFVNGDSWDFDPRNYHDNWGIGLRFDLPGFPLHLDYAWPMTYDDRYLDGAGRVNFLIGHTF